MKIKIDIKNRHRIDAALAEAAGGAWAYTLTDYKEIEQLAQRAEQQLEESGLLVKDRRGARLVHSPAGPGAAYARHGYRITTTLVIMERSTTGWTLTSVERFDKAAWEKETHDMQITFAQSELIKAHAMSCYSISSDRGVIQRNAIATARHFEDDGKVIKSNVAIVA